MTLNFSTKLFRQEAKFIAGAAKPNQLPKFFLPQVAFVGKSNVGKSSLINSICRRKDLARVSNTPGRTQQINFFSLAEKIILVDLPGYGFAKVPKQQKHEWEHLILYYLENSPKLELVYVLIDARRGVKDNDLKIIQLLVSRGKNIELVFTKCDKVNLTEDFETKTKNLLATLECSFNIIFFSSKSGVGAKQLQLSIMQYIHRSKAN